jgi:hypothetical protein
MRVLSLGNDAFAIEPDHGADSIANLGDSTLRRSRVSDEAIRIYRHYVDAAGSGALASDAFKSASSSASGGPVIGTDNSK